MEKINKLIHFFSLTSGEIYKVFEDEIKNLDKYQIPLKSLPSTSCRKCYGRGYFGKDLKLNIFLVCKCMQKHINFDKFNQEITVETPKQVH